MTLQFSCPTAQQMIDSGMEMDEQTFRTARLRIVTVSCPHCDRKHRFLLADGVRTYAEAT
ncbi:hypothetical protein [Rhodoplanes sp. Z2-YC6860]|uniref:hypothetical protein n=1 Tax=Rhodoplanes sp. Z2-YC6860 TaxID=674703 RepID=UPI000830E4B8|nr:hypothetical protein [Rhodoplanes sp. Z2-YC6860]